MGSCNELSSILKDCGTQVVFGLKAQGHIPVIERMLAEGAEWEAIGREIGWHGPTAREHYALYQLGERILAAERSRLRDAAR